MDKVTKVVATVELVGLPLILLVAVLTQTLPGETAPSAWPKVVVAFFAMAAGLFGGLCLPEVWQDRRVHFVAIAHLGLLVIFHNGVAIIASWLGMRLVAIAQGTGNALGALGGWLGGQAGQIWPAMQTAFSDGYLLAGLTLFLLGIGWLFRPPAWAGRNNEQVGNERE